MPDADMISGTLTCALRTAIQLYVKLLHVKEPAL
jgi:hypothetical protein